METPSFGEEQTLDLSQNFSLSRVLITTALRPDQQHYLGSAAVNLLVYYVGYRIGRRLNL